MFARDLDKSEPATGKAEQLPEEEWRVSCPLPLTVGPIVGAGSQCQGVFRVWGRGRNAVCGEERKPLACTAVLSATGGGPVLTASMPAEDDFTSVFDVPLSSGEAWCSSSTIQYRFGFISHPPGGEIGELTAELLEGLPVYEARLLPNSSNGDAPNQPFDLWFGSCKYMIRLFGSADYAGIADSCFAQMEKSGQPANMMALLGDQMYADCAGILDPVDELPEFRWKYRGAFRTPAHRRLMAQMPVAMTWDDHEIWDNFDVDAAKQSPEELDCFHAARTAYAEYQLSHSPLGGPGGAIKKRLGETNKLWYSFSAGQHVEFFVLDVRGCRSNRSDPRVCLGTEQMDALKVWLTSCSPDSVKILLSGVPMAPDFEGGDLRDKLSSSFRKAQRLFGFDVEEPGNDRWEEYAQERAEILDCIRQQRVRRVVILSGDVHFGYSARIHCPRDLEFEVLQFTASPFFWPFEHMSIVARNKATPLCTFDDGAACYTEVIDGKFCETDHFGWLRIHFDECGVPSGVECQHKDSHGNVVLSSKVNLR